MYKIIEWLKAAACALGGVAAYIWGPADALINNACLPCRV